MENRSDYLQGCRFEGDVDAALADMDSPDQASVDDQLVAGDAPCVLQAAGERGPREAGRHGELQACGAISDHNYCGDVERCMVLGPSYALLLTWVALACSAAMTKASTFMPWGV